MRLLFLLLLSPLCFAQGRLPAGAANAATPDDSEPARQSALARLRSAAPGPVCGDASRMSRSYGTTCASREFAAPPLLAPPKIVWHVKPGWWGAWSPLLVSGRVLSGSCNNSDNKGLSAFDMASGKLLWRIPAPCDAGNRAGSMGNVALHELPSGEILWIYPRDDNGPTDFFVVDPAAGRIVRSLQPIKRGPTSGHDGPFIVLTQSSADNTSYLNALNPSLDKILWRNDGFRAACKDKLDPHCKPVFSAPASSHGILLQTATAKDQPEPPTRQLHAIDLQTGRTLWRHTAQPAVESVRRGDALLSYRSDDGPPFVAAGKVIIQVEGLLPPATPGGQPHGAALRALDLRSGATLWTTTPIPTRLAEPWGGASTQFLNNRLAAAGTLVTEVQTHGAKELWGYRLADGALLWRRSVPTQTRLLASAGGVFYISERATNEDFLLQALDALTGTRLWTSAIPGHDMPFDQQWGLADSTKGNAQGPSWRIGPDGAIYGVSLLGVYKIQ